MILVFTYSLYAIKTIENEFEQKDARQIVIDEVIGQSIPIFLVEYITFLQTQSFGADLYLYAISFFLFRFFDILKPFPIGYFDKNYKNSFGILFDDVLAGIYTLIVLLLLIKFCPIKFGLKLFNELSGDSSILLVKKKSLAKSSILVKFGSLSPMSCKAIILRTSSVSVV